MNEKELKELQAIKKLLVVQLLVSGVQASELAKLLGMTKGNFSTMFPARQLLKRLKEDNDDENAKS